VDSVIRYQPKEFLPASISHNNQVHITVTANCSRFVTYLLTCVENNVIDCASRIFGLNKNFGVAPPMCKGKRTYAYNTCIAPQVTYRDFRGAGTTQARADVRSLLAV